MQPMVEQEATKVFEEKGAKVDYLVGTMIEIPRAAVTADEIAETAQFFSSLGYRSTMIETLDGSIIAFQNSQLFNKNFRNMTRNHK